MGLGIIAIALLLCFQFFMMRKMYYYHVIYLIWETRKDSSFEFFFGEECSFPRVVFLMLFIKVEAA